ncbi:MAG TPA: hypothetical protein VGF30_10150 [Bacteroidia bacterium]
MKTNQFTEGLVTFNDGILHIVYHEGVILDEHVFMKQIECRKRITGDQSFFMILDMSQASDISESGLAFAAENPHPGNVRAIAVITRKGQDYIRAKLYSVFDQPNIPTKAFLSEEDALHWFGSFESEKSKKAA